MTKFIGSPSGYDALGAIFHHSMQRGTPYSVIVNKDLTDSFLDDSYGSKVCLETCLTAINKKLNWSVASN